MALLLHLNSPDEASWAQRLGARLSGYRIVRRGEAWNPADIRYILVWKSDANAFDGLVNLKAILSAGAGVDALIAHPHLPSGVPIVRFVDNNLSRRMSEYVTAEVLRHHRLDSHFRAEQARKHWEEFCPPVARELGVGIMGLGVLGQAAIEMLKPLGYRLSGWSRTAKRIEGVTTFTGSGGFEDFLSGTDILVNLLPLTPETRGILNRETFGKLRRGVLPGGPVIVNAARGGHLVEADLAAALGEGTLGAASLDVFATEPLPKDSPLWTLPNCYITPHVAAVSDPRHAADYFAHVIEECEAGRPLPNVVDLARGY